MQNKISEMLTAVLRKLLPCQIEFYNRANETEKLLSYSGLSECALNVSAHQSYYVRKAWRNIYETVPHRLL